VPSSSCTSRVIPLHTAVRSPLVPSSGSPIAADGLFPGGWCSGWLSASEEAVHQPGGFGRVGSSPSRQITTDRLQPAG
jgi:hypothetical protein